MEDLRDLTDTDAPPPVRVWPFIKGLVLAETEQDAPAACSTKPGRSLFVLRNLVRHGSFPLQS